MVTCGKCRKGHILAGDHWIPCDCLINSSIRRSITLLGAQNCFDAVDIAKLPTTVPELASLKKAVMGFVDPPHLLGKSVLLYGQGNDVLAYSLLWWYLRFQIPCRISTLEHCTDLFVGKQREAYKDIREAPVLALFCGKELLSNVHKQLVEFFTSLRSSRGYSTIFVFGRDMKDVGMYGRDFYSFVTDPRRCTSLSCDPIAKHVARRKKNEGIQDPAVG